MVSGSTKTPYQKVSKISLWSGKSQGKVPGREDESRKKWPPWELSPFKSLNLWDEMIAF